MVGRVLTVAAIVAALLAVYGLREPLPGAMAHFTSCRGWSRLMRSLGRFEDYLTESERVRAVSGLSEAYYARARNNGRQRTPDKRLFLETIAERARAAGVEPLPANF